MTTHSYPELEKALKEIIQQDNLRELQSCGAREGASIWHNNQKGLNLSSNDYLGLATDTRLRDQFLSEHPLECLGASSSRLLSGNHVAYTDLEGLLKTLFQRDAALVFNSGYHANLGIIPALYGPKDCIFSDRMNHASLIDGIRLSGAKLIRYNHNNPAHLESLLEKHRATYQQAVIISESIFSMDGDKADLKTLCALKKKFKTHLYIDEAHAFGVTGEQGLGECESQGVIHQVDFMVGTFGKALAAMGAFIVADKIVVDYLINRMRPFIFTTALPPFLVRWIHFLVNRLPQMKEKRQHLMTLQNWLREALQQQGLQTGGDSHIIPVHLGDNTLALTTAKKLQALGYLLFAIRPPTVPANACRLRISLSATMTLDELKPLPQTIFSTLPTPIHEII